MTVLIEDEILEIRESLDSLDAAGLEEAVARRVEKTAAAGNPVRADGLVPLYIIRPGIGRGRGKHLYEAEMLEREVAEGRFKGWKMYVDHQAPEAKKASGGLPRSIRDLGGFIKEAWWDGAVPADPDRGWGKGAVVGLAKPTPADARPDRGHPRGHRGVHLRERDERCAPSSATGTPSGSWRGSSRRAQSTSSPRQVQEGGSSRSWRR